MSKNMFDQIFNAEHFKNPFFGNAEAFQKAWQDTLQKKQMSFSQSSEQNIEELDKRINELKSVENWLSLNLSMLKNTIQSLELQRTNLQSLQEMMQNNEALQMAGQQWWNSLQEQFQDFLKTQSDMLEQSQQKVDTLDKTTQKDAPLSSSKLVKNKPATKVARKTSLKKG